MGLNYKEEYEEMKKELAQVKKEKLGYLILVMVQAIAVVVLLTTITRLTN